MAQPAEKIAESTTPDTWLGRHRRVLLMGGPVLVAVVAIVLYLTGGRYVSTDDAYLQSARVQVSCNGSGRVSEVKVHDNESVHAGQVLFSLDSRPFQIAVEDAEAQLAGARLKVKGLQAVYRQRLANEQAGRNTLAFEER